MAIVTMKKLTLLALNSDKESIFDALIQSNAVELKRSADIEACTSPDVSAERERLLEKIARVEDGIAYVTEQTERYNDKYKRNKAVAEIKLPKNSLSRPKTEVNYDCFLHFGSKTARIDDDLATLSLLKTQLNEAAAEIAQKQTDIKRLKLIANLPHPTDWYKDTDTAKVELVQFNESELNNVKKLVAEYDMADIEVIDCVDSTVVAVAIVHKSQTEFFERATAYGVIKCSVACSVLPCVAIEDIERQLKGLSEQQNGVEARVASYSKNVTEWKVYSDYLSLCEKKLQADGDLQQTDKTFVLEAYYPAEAEQKVIKAVNDVTNYSVMTFDEIGEEEFAPTLVKSNKLVGPFEAVTNMYSPPDYHEVDPNPIMSIFYFIIFGFMVADIGYGLLLLIAGIAATFVIKQRTGIKTMLQMFGICGISAVIVGALFGSFFCYSTGADGLKLYEGLIPAPDAYPMVMMIISLMLGIIHICAGIGCKMAVKIKRKQHLAAWLSDFPWIIVFVSLILAIFNMAMDMAAYEPWASVRLPNMVSQVALYVCLGALAVGVIFAGLLSKGILGKLKSSFGAVYGIINYFSDIMSYIRVFGLMLSSALVGSVINDISKMLMGGGNIGYVFAAIVLVAAHLFNLAMGILSVYIHNGRLQYVEFFGKFYTGEGSLFVPFGSDTKYVLVKEK